MANRLFRSQSLYSFFTKPVKLGGHFSVNAPTKASLVTQGLTLTAVLYGVAQDAITIAFTAGATAGSEVVTVVGNAISVQIATGVSTVTQVRTAMQASGACTALVTTTGTSASTVATAAAVPLAGAVESVTSFYGTGIQSILQSGTGQYTITLQDRYYWLINAIFSVLAATPVDLVPQMLSQAVKTSAPTIVVSLLTAATPTNPAAAATVYFEFFFNDSSLGG